MQRLGSTSQLRVFVFSKNAFNSVSSAGVLLGSWIRRYSALNTDIYSYLPKIVCKHRNNTTVINLFDNLSYKYNHNLLGNFKDEI